MNGKTRSPASVRPVSAALSALALSAALLGGCAVYKPEIIQGNFVSKEQAAALQPGMPREVVRQVLGTPLLSDLFRSNRWDYVFSIQHRPGVTPQKYALAVYFEGDVLSRVEGADNLPGEMDFVKTLGGKRTYKPRNLDADPQKLESFAQQNKPREVQPDTPKAPAATSYPPLPR